MLEFRRLTASFVHSIKHIDFGLHYRKKTNINNLDYQLKWELRRVNFWINTPVCSFVKMFELTEPLAITLMTRFLNHLDLLDTIPTSATDSNALSVEMQKEHADAVLRNLLAVGRFLGGREDIKWVGSKKRKNLGSNEDEKAELVDNDLEEDASGTFDITDVAETALIAETTATAPMAFVVLMDKVCKIGRKCHHVLPISTSLKFYAAILVSSSGVFASKTEDETFGPAFVSMLKLIDHVQTFSISRDQVRSKEWRSTLELSTLLLDRVKTLLGADRHGVLNLALVKSMSAARLSRKEEKRRLVMIDPEKAAKIKAKENQKKYKARKVSSNRKPKRKY